MKLNYFFRYTNLFYVFRHICDTKDNQLTNFNDFENFPKLNSLLEIIILHPVSGANAIAPENNLMNAFTENSSIHQFK